MRHEQRVAKCDFEKFTDISEVLQPLPSAKKATIAVFLLTSTFASLVLQGVGCALLTPWTSLPRDCVFRYTV